MSLKAPSENGISDLGRGKHSSNPSFLPRQAACGGETISSPARPFSFQSRQSIPTLAFLTTLVTSGWSPWGRHSTMGSKCELAMCRWLPPSDASSHGQPHHHSSAGLDCSPPSWVSTQLVWIPSRVDADALDLIINQPKVGFSDQVPCPRPLSFLSDHRFPFLLIQLPRSLVVSSDNPPFSRVALLLLLLSLFSLEPPSIISRVTLQQQQPHQ
ncbi:hypothetical protein B0T17DRAFT_166012 [Bombardia bombarda]|uniref:Uncharacterized protein n=1 Tax=Bombardia bombarda TaxID=252184 RepID=A0AA39X7Y0_9PEZI|nr:hypothetical protein B0T17DRAFT_166012 [Bombardia bombarda]